MALREVEIANRFQGGNLPEAAGGLQVAGLAGALQATFLFLSQFIVLVHPFWHCVIGPVHCSFAPAGATPPAVPSQLLPTLPPPHRCQRFPLERAQRWWMLTLTLMPGQDVHCQ
jgi:hypothetical protein